MASHLRAPDRAPPAPWLRVDGAELARRQALAALLWGDVPFDRPIIAIAPGAGIAFALAQDAGLPPIAGRANALARDLDLASAHAPSVQAEAALGARVTDAAVVPLALAIAVQLRRIRERNPIGAGDSMVVGLVWGLLQGEAQEALR